MKTVWKVVKHNYELIIMILVAILLAFWAFGCEPKVHSLNGSNRLVSREELTCEIDAFFEMSKVRIGELDKKEKLKEELIEQLTVFGETGSINPIGVISSLLGLIGAGALLDNRRKDALLKTYKRLFPHIPEDPKK